MKATVVVTPKFGTAYSVYSVIYNGAVIHTSISALDKEDVDDAVNKHLAAPKLSPTPKLRPIAAAKSLQLAGSKAAASTAFRKATQPVDSSFYIEDEHGNI